MSQPTTADTRRVSKHDVLVIYRGDPIAALLDHIFRRHLSLLLIGLIALGLAVLAFVVPSTWGTLHPSRGFDAPLFYANAALDWVLLIPVSALLFVRQLDSIPRLFLSLQSAKVLGITASDVEAFRRRATKIYNSWHWFVAASILPVPIWYAFVRSVLEVPTLGKWTSRSVALWIVYFGIEYVFSIELLMYLLRQIITWQLLKRLLKQASVQPFVVLAEQDGWGGLYPVVHFVRTTFVVFGSVFIVVALKFLNSASIIPNIESSSSAASFGFVAVIYLAIFPLIVLDPMMLVFHIIGQVKANLRNEISTWLVSAAVELQNQIDQDGLHNHLEHLTKLANLIEMRERMSVLLDRLPGSLTQVPVRSLVVTALSAVFPLIFGAVLRSASVTFMENWSSYLLHLKL